MISSWRKSAGRLLALCRYALVLCLVASAQAELRIYTEPAAPTAFMQDGEMRGFGVDLVNALIERTGANTSIQMMPWSRAYTLAQREPNVGLFAMIRTPEREPLFQWVGPILEGTVRFYSLRSRHLQVDDLADVKASGLLAVPRDWYLFDVLAGMGLNNLHGVRTPDVMLNMFRHGRTSLVPLEDILLRQMLAPAGLKPEDVQPHMAVTQSAYYIGFSLDTDPEIVTAWQQALAEMRRDGSFSAIFRQWLPEVPLAAALP